MRLNAAQKRAQAVAGRHELHWQPGGGPPDEIWLYTLLGARTTSYCSYHTDLGYIRTGGRGARAVTVLTEARKAWGTAE